MVFPVAQEQTVRASSTSTLLRAAKAYVYGNREGQEWLIRHCRTNGVEVGRRPGAVGETH